jgi:DNA polymerase I-like protein with 3'-5' exonuclease and polymerase domains
MVSRYKIITTKKEVKQLIKACKATKYCCFDFETNAESIYHADFYPTILSVSFQVGSSIIIPLAHFDSPFKDNWEEILKYFGKRVIENRDITKVAWNWKFDNQIMHKYGVYHSGRALDGMLAKYLLNEERPNGLKEMVELYLPEMAGYENYEGSKLPWAQRPLEGLSEYAGRDTDATLRLTLFFEKKLIDLGFYSLYRNLIMMASRVLEDTERWGMRLDVPLNDELQITYAKRIKETEEALRSIKKVKRFCKSYTQDRIDAYIQSIQNEIDELEEDAQGNARKITSREEKIKRLRTKQFETKKELELIEPINFGSQKQMVELLYLHPKGLKLPIVRYTKDKYKRDTETPSTAEDTLLELKKYDKAGFIDTLLKLRGLNTTMSTFILGIRDKIGADGRIHPKFNIIGTVTGRLSCTSGGTLIHTDHGPIPIKELCPSEVGECGIATNFHTLTHTGKWQRITKGINKGQDMMYLVKLEDGSSIKCTLNHRFITNQGEVSLGEIYKNFQNGTICKYKLLKLVDHG